MHATDLILHILHCEKLVKTQLVDCNVHSCTDVS